MRSKAGQGDYNKKGEIAIRVDFVAVKKKNK